MLGDAGELLDALSIWPARTYRSPSALARVPVARLCLDDPHVLGDRRVELALAEQLLRLLERVFAIDCHGIPAGIV